MTYEARRGNTFLRLLFGSALVVIFGGAVIAAFLYFSGKNSGVVAMEFEKPGSVTVGEPFIVRLLLSNSSEETLKSASLLLTLPEGVAFLGQPEDQQVRERAIGDLSPGAVSTEEIQLIALSGSYTEKRIEAELSYLLPGTSARFEQHSEADISLRDAAATLTFTLPQSVGSGERFSFEVEYKNLSGIELKNLSLQLSYPSQFRFESASPAPSVGNHEWKVATFAKDASQKIVITGNAVAPEKSPFAFDASLRASFAGRTYAIATQTVNTEIATSPLSVEVRVRGEKSFVAEVGEMLEYLIVYKNNASMPFEHVMLRATLSGEMFDLATLQSSGAWNAVSRTVNWTSGQVPAFAPLPPGGTGEVSIRVKVKDAFPARRMGDKNYSLRLQAVIESTTVAPGSTASRTQSIDSLDAKVGGFFRLDAQAFHTDTSGIVNAGSYPAKAGQNTQYVIKWLVSVAGADMANAEVSAALPLGVGFTGQTKQNAGSAVTYDTKTRKVSWQIPVLVANKGFVSPAGEAVFQVEVVPSASQAGQAVPLLGETSLTAEDVFTKLPVALADDPLGTDIPDDVGVGEVPREVQS